MALARSLGACDDPCGLPDRPRPEPVRGTIDDFTAGPRQVPPVTVAAPVACAPRAAEVTAILVSHAGSVPLRYGATEPATVDAEPRLGELERRLVADGVRVHGHDYATACGGAGAFPFLATDDWRDADAIVTAVEVALEADDLDGAVEIRVEATTVAGADLECGS